MKTHYLKKCRIPLYAMLLLLFGGLLFGTGQAQELKSYHDLIIEADQDNVGGGTLYLRSGGGEVLAISPDNRVGIGTTTPQYKLDVNDTVNASAYLLNGSPLQQSYWNKSGSDINYTAGKVAVGNMPYAPQALLHVADAYGPGNKNLMVGDDTYFTDIDTSDVLGLYGNANKDRGGLQLGEKGAYIWGNNNAVGIGAEPSTGDRLFVNGRIRFGDSEFLEDAGSNAATLSGSLHPSTNGGFNIGNSGARWNTIWATNGTIQTSDKRDKTQIKTLNYGLDAVLALKPVSYTWKKRPHEGTQVGLIAQEANEVIPEVVFDPAEEYRLDEKGNWVRAEVTAESRFGINYGLLTPVLIRAIQEQQAQIEAQQAQLDEQKRLLSSLSQGQAGAKAPATSRELSLPQLYQNVPNPFDQLTEIRFFLPESVQKATLYIYDMQGTPVKEVSLQDRGESAWLLDGSQLSAGMYLYALIADGQEVAVKRMILTHNR